MSHIKYLEHLSPFGTALGFNQIKQWRNWHQVVFRNVHIVGKMQHFCLRTTRTMNHTFHYFPTTFVEYLFHNWGIGSGWRQNQFTRIQRRTFNRIG